MRLLIAILLTFLLLLSGACQNNSSFKIAVSYPKIYGQEGLDGRIILIFSKENQKEPRFQVSAGANAAQIFGINVSGFIPGKEVIIDHSVFGYPMQSLDQIKEGEYYVQAVFHRYETFHLKTGQTVKLPMDRGEGQQWNKAPGNLYSTPLKIVINPGENKTIHLNLKNIIAPVNGPKDTRYIRYIRIQSKKLTEFWGRPIFLQANVLLPQNFSKSKNIKYPLMVFHGHFPKSVWGFRSTPPNADPNDGVYNERFRITGYKYIQQKEAYEFYKIWTSPDFPRYVVIEIQHPTPYYDDSYAVNSANMGPYGDAITYELIPEVEKIFNCVGEGWGRFLYGGSTGGWEALAAQIFYPDEYNGCFAACPDPIDFRAYTVVNIYDDKNAYYQEGPFNRILRPGTRDYRGHIKNFLIDENHLELALADKGRSGGQWDIWQAVYSPMGKDGYPQPIWDKKSGVIDEKVAQYWRDNYDLRFILERDWAKIGNKLKGKIHIYCGDMDNYYLNNAVVLMEKFLKDTKNPYYGGEVTYGDGNEHCWNGDPDQPNYISRLRYNTMYLSKIKKRLKETAPRGNHLVNWK